MNAKELIEAAERMNEEWNINRIASEDLQAVVNHILSTVRPDDDEPVTRERLEDDGWSWDEDRKGWITIIRLPKAFQVQDVNGTWVLWNPYCPLKSIGHLRRLVAALGE